MKNGRPRDYMKYWRVIRYFVKRKYGLNTEELDMLFFLYSEEYFNVDKFNEFNSVLGWNKKRFKKACKFLFHLGIDLFSMLAGLGTPKGIQNGAKSC